VLTSVCHAAYKKDDIQIISDFTDIIYLYHETNGQPSINPEDFLNNTQLARSREWESKFSRLAESYLSTTDVFKKKEILEAASNEIQKYKPTFSGDTIAVWKFVELEAFNFDRNSFSVKFPDKTKTSISSKNYVITWEYDSDQYEYIVGSIEEAKIIEKISVQASNMQFVGRKRMLPALFLFDVKKSFEAKEKKYTELSLKSVEVYKPNTKRVSFNRRESMLFHFAPIKKK
jgi:hypothetical protein